MFLRQAAAIAGLAAILALGAPQGYAHEGHVHADEPAPVAAAGIGPRAESASSSFELVAIPRGDNAQSGQRYVLDAPFLVKPGRYDLIVTVTAGNLADVLPLSIEVPPAI